MYFFASISCRIFSPILSSSRIFNFKFFCDFHRQIVNDYHSSLFYLPASAPLYWKSYFMTLLSCSNMLGSIFSDIGAWKEMPASRYHTPSNWREGIQVRGEAGMGSTQNRFEIWMIMNRAGDVKRGKVEKAHPTRISTTCGQVYM